MIALTLDRFLEVYLNLKYPLHCTKRKTRIALHIAKGLSLLLFIGFCIGYRHYNEVHSILALYFWPITEGTFLVVALFTYTYLFIRIRRNRKNFSKIMKSVQRTRSETQEAIFRRRNLKRILRKFYVPSLLIATFILFWIFPDMVEFVKMVQGEPVSSEVSLVINICYALAMFSDALIYVFSTLPIRKYLYECITNNGITLQ